MVDDLNTGAEGSSGTLKRVRVTLHISQKLADEMRGAVLELSDLSGPLTMGRLATRALQKHIMALRKIHNDGEPFCTKACSPSVSWHELLGR